MVWMGMIEMHFIYTWIIRVNLGKNPTQIMVHATNDVDPDSSGSVDPEVWNEGKSSNETAGKRNKLKEYIIAEILLVLVLLANV